MLRSTYSYLATLPPVFIDGAIYMFSAMFIALNSEIGSDEAAKWINPALLFWLRTTITTFLAGLVALKMFRSTSYAEHQETKKNGGTNHWTKLEAPPIKVPTPTITDIKHE